MTDSYSVQQILGNRIAQTPPVGDASNRVATTNFVAQGVVINPTGNSTNQGLAITQTGPTTGTQTTQLNFNQIFVTSDQSNNTSGQGACALEIFYQFGGAHAAGAKQCIFAWANLNEQPSNVDPFYSSGNFLCQANVTAGGTDTDSGALGSCEGLLAFASLQGTALNFSSCVGLEATVQILTGASSRARHGVSLVSAGNVHAPNNSGDQEDAAVHIGAGVGGTVSWLKGIYLSHWNGAAPLDTSGIVIDSDGQSDTINSVINLPAWTISSNIFNFKNWQVTGTGNTGIGKAAMTTAWGAISPSLASVAHLNLAAGTTVTAPNDGDLWYDGSHLLIRIGATTRTVTVT